MGATQAATPNLPPLRDASFEVCQRGSATTAAEDDFDDDDDDADDEEGADDVLS